MTVGYLLCLPVHGGILSSSSLALQPNAEKPKNLDAESAEDGGPDYQENDPKDFPAVNASLDKQVEHSAHYPAVANVEGAPLTGWTIDKLRRPNGELCLVSTPPWSNRSPFVQPLAWLSIGWTLQTLERDRWLKEDPQGLGMLNVDMPL